MLTVATALLILGAVANSVQIAQGTAQAAKWAIEKLKSNDPHAVAIVQSLPADASAETIILALRAGIGGSASVTTANGGRMRVTDASVAAGAGRAKGGDLTISADGGDLEIVGGTYKAGDGTG
jgi:hypothetical protein